jgi:hypothetical protein
MDRLFFARALNFVVTAQMIRVVVLRRHGSSGSQCGRQPVTASTN